MQPALELLRSRSIPVAWSDVRAFSRRRNAGTLIALARLFVNRPTELPLAIWLRCATHFDALLEQSEEVTPVLLDAIRIACSAATPESASGASDVLHRALVVLTNALPRVDHRGYLELRRNAAGAPVASLLARLWLAMIRLSPNAEGYVLTPYFK